VTGTPDGSNGADGSGSAVWHGTGRVPTQTLQTDQAGAPWWRYRRGDGVVTLWRPAPGAGNGHDAHGEHDVHDGHAGNGDAGNGHGVGGSSGNGSGPGGHVPHEPPPWDDEPEEERRTSILPVHVGSGAGPGVLAVLLAAIVLVNGRFVGAANVSRALVPIAGVLAAMAFAPMLARRHPDEPWIARLLVLGAAFKVISSILRYYTMVGVYGSPGDATHYHQYGSQFVRGIAEPLDDWRETNFVRWVVGNVYSWLGIDMIAGFFVFGLAAFVGSYLWYRATVNAVPFIDKRLYCILVFFAPSIAFWPSSIGKEAMMQLAMGVTVLGVAKLLKGRPLRGLLVATPGYWLLWMVRPHLFAIAACATGLAYLVGRRPKPDDDPLNISLMRPIATVLVGFLVMFALTQASNFLGMEEFSLQAVEEELSDTSERTATGGSVIGEAEDTSVSLTPLSLPLGAVTVLLRPFPFEVDSGVQLLASLESAILAWFMWKRRAALAVALRRARSVPFLFYCWTFIAIYVTAFSSFKNMGLLVRQRSLALAALFVLLSIDTGLAKKKRRDPFDDLLLEPGSDDRPRQPVLVR
jgi:hypothetical protein